MRAEHSREDMDALCAEVMDLCGERNGKEVVKALRFVQWYREEEARARGASAWYRATEAQRTNTEVLSG